MILKRISSSRHIDNIVVATTCDLSDDQLVNWLKANDYNYFRGSVSNVLERFYLASTPFSPSIIVRITADDPFKDSDIIDLAIQTILSEPKYDYVSNTIIPTFPEGLDIEVFTFNALQHAYQNARLASDLEHVTPYIWTKPNIFNLFNFTNALDLSAYRLTIDYPVDLATTYKILNYFDGDIYVPAQNILREISTGSLLLDQTCVIRNEGYINSLQSDVPN